MSDADHVTLARINYWCREKHYRHMQTAALDGLRRHGNDPVLKFYSAYSMLLEGRVQEGMRELEVLKDRQEINLCSIMALMYGHKKATNVDREAVSELDALLKTVRKTAGEKGLYYAGVFLFHAGRYDKAREYVDRMLKISPESKEGLAIKGWIELLCGREAYAKKSIKFFDEALSLEGQKDIDALFGKARYFGMRRNFSAALELVNQAVVTVNNFLPAFIEKMKIQLALQDWEQTIETAVRAMNVDSSCLQARRYDILQTLCRDGNYPDAAAKIGELLEQMDRVEPKNAFLFDDFAKVFCRLSGRNKEVLQQCYFLAERAVSIESTNASYLTELGHQLLLSGKVRDAVRCYRSAMKLDETSVSALTGIIRCQLQEDQLEDAAQQLEFLQEIQQTIGKSAELLYLNAVLAMKRQKPTDQVLELMNDAIETHFAGLKGIPLGPDYFFCMNPDFLLQVVNDYLKFAPEKPVTSGQPANQVLKRCVQVLEPMSRAVPGLLEGLYLLAKVKYLAGEVDSAQSTLQHCLNQEGTYSDAHILMAQIHLHQNNFKLANQSLEQGLSLNFEVRDSPLFHLIKSRILRKQGDTAEAVRTLQLAMSLPGVKKSGRNIKNASKSATISVNDRVSVFLELAEAHRILDEQHEAAKVMQDALNEFSGTGEEIRISIANADLALAREDVEGALAMLRNITPEQAYFVQAREKMADIYLNHRKDKRLYTSCYRELVDKYPSPHTCLLLGDAYMSIQEPEKAIEVYEAALKKNPRDGTLASKIGQALVKTHNYGKAISYYEASLKSEPKPFLRHDLAELLIKLRQFDKAEKVLKLALEANATPSDLDGMMENTQYLVLLSKVYHKQDKLEDSLLQLSKARDMQQRVLKRVTVEQPDAVVAQRSLAANICSEMAQHACQTRDYDKAIRFYKEALSAGAGEGDGKLSLELARLYLTTEDLDGCMQQCMQLLKSDEENDAATIMLADLMFRRNEYDQAMYHFQQLLERRPDHYEALARLVDLMRRAGKLDEVPRFIELAEAASSRVHIDAGYNYCKGLCEWYTGNPNNALKFFNKARKDSDWGMRATCNMIEICLNPDNNTLGGEVFDGVDTAADMPVNADKSDSEKMAFMTAEKLLREMKPKAGDIRARLLENMALLASKNKTNAEKALSSFMEISSTEREHVGALYGMAAAYMVLKQTPRARNQLKRVAKNTWTAEDGDDLEKSWLLLADIYIQSAKYDMATELLKRCLEHNKCCCKAYEYMGYIMEKEQSYKDAARNYEMAWKYGNKNNPNIGYKLGFNYLKARRFVDAIDICHNVLEQHPNYPKIRKDILDKARMSIRV